MKRDTGNATSRERAIRPVSQHPHSHDVEEESKKRRNVANVIGEAGVSFSTKRRIVPDVVARQMAPPCLLEDSSVSV